MARGNLFQSRAVGSIGEVTFSVVKGQQISRFRNRTPTNPRTYSQMSQRARFASAVKFYKRSSQSFFRMAFEDKTARESDYNAFMRLNKNNYIAMPQWYTEKGAPMISNWQICEGSAPWTSLNNAISYSDSDQGMGIIASVTFSSSELPQEGINTIGDLSKFLIDEIGSEYQWQEGDILTQIVCYCPVATHLFSEDRAAYGYLSAEAWGELIPQYWPRFRTIWVVSQIIIDSTSTQALPTNLVLDASGFTALNTTYSQSLVSFSFVHSRNTATGILVGSEFMQIANSLEPAVTMWTSDKGWLKTIAADWQAHAEAVLSGSEAAN